MQFELAGDRYSVYNIALGAALTVTSAAGLVCLAAGWALWPGLAFLFVFVFGWVVWDRGNRLFALYEQAAAPSPALAEPDEAEPPAEPETESRPDIGLGDWGHFFTLVRQYNASLPNERHEPDAFRLWGWECLHTGAGYWVDVTDALEAAHWCDKGNNGTFLRVPVADFAAMVYTGRVIPPPFPAQWRGYAAGKMGAGKPEGPAVGR